MSEKESDSTQDQIQEKFFVSFFSTVDKSPDLHRSLRRLYLSIYHPEVIDELGVDEKDDKFEDRIPTLTSKIASAEESKPGVLEFLSKVRETVLNADISYSMFPHARETFNESIKNEKFDKIIIWTGGDEDWQEHKVRSGLFSNPSSQLPDNVILYAENKKGGSFETLAGEEELESYQVVYVIEDHPKFLSEVLKGDRPNLVAIRLKQGKHKNKKAPEGVIELENIGELSEYLENDLREREIEKGSAAIVYDFDGTLCDDDKRWESTAREVYKLLKEEGWLQK